MIEQPLTPKEVQDLEFDFGQFAGPEVLNRVPK